MKLIYLASPYTHKSRKVEKQRYVEVTKAAATLMHRTRYAFFLPITQSFQLVKCCPDLGSTFKNWEQIDLYVLKKCDELWVVQLDGWDKSVGVTAEIAFAKKLKKPIFYISPSTLALVGGGE